MQRSARGSRLKARAVACLRQGRRARAAVAIRLRVALRWTRVLARRFRRGTVSPDFGTAAAEQTQAGDVASAPAVSPEVVQPGVELFRTVPIERYDDIASIRSKLHAGPGRTVVARIDRRNESLRSQLGMRLLRRHVDATRLHLVLQTRDGRIRRLARDEGLVVVGSMRGREIKHGRLMPRYLRLGFLALPLPSSDLVFRLIALAALPLAVVSAAAFGPSATVRLAPELTAVAVPLFVEARVLSEGDIVEEGILPARRVAVEIVATDTVATTGQVAISGNRATGTLRIENQTSLPLEVPIGTDVGAISGVRFRTIEAAIVPAGSGSVAFAGIEAERVGSEGNVSAGAVVLPGLALAGRAEVSNPDPTTGGDAAYVRGPHFLDVDRVRSASAHTLRVRALEVLERQARGRFVFHPDTLNVEVLSEEFLPELGQPGDTLAVTTIAAVSVIGVSIDEIRSHAAREIRRTQGSGFAVVTESLEPVAIGEASVNETLDAISFDMMVEGHVASTIIPEAVERAVRLERVSSAEAKLNSALRLREPARIDVTPSFMPLISPFDFRIRVEVIDTLPLVPEEGTAESAGSSIGRNDALPGGGDLVDDPFEEVDG